MEYALYKGLRTAAQPGLKAVCEHCGSEVIAKCGSKKMWHWAHTRVDGCDSWNEPETLWHRQWKDEFGERYSEIRIGKEECYHIADVVNKDGIIFEFQNSSISSDVIAEREAFYGEKMIWVINGESFKTNFRMYDGAFKKDWSVHFLSDYESAENYRPFQTGSIIEAWQVKQEAVKELLKQYGFSYLPDEQIYYYPVNGLVSKWAIESEISDEILELYETHKPSQDSAKGEFAWSHARRSWEDAKRPVFIDFGEDNVYWVTEGMGKAYGVGVKISKAKFIEKYRGE